MKPYKELPELMMMPKERFLSLKSKHLQDLYLGWLDGAPGKMSPQVGAA